MDEAGIAVGGVVVACGGPGDRAHLWRRRSGRPVISPVWGSSRRTPRDQTSFLREQLGDRLAAFPAPILSYIKISCARAHPADPRVRRALSLAISRRRLNAQVFNGEAARLGASSPLLHERAYWMGAERVGIPGAIQGASWSWGDPHSALIGRECALTQD